MDVKWYARSLPVHVSAETVIKREINRGLVCSNLFFIVVTVS